MVSKAELAAWLQDSVGDYVAVDDGGLTLVTLDEEGKEMAAYFEIGGIPEDEGTE